MEGFAYDFKRDIEQYGQLEKYVDPATRDQLIKQLNNEVEWLYGEGEHASFQEINGKLQHYRMQRQQIKNRSDFYSEIDIYIQQFEAFSGKVEAVFTMPRLTDQQRDQFMQKQQTTAEMIQAIK